MLVLTADPVQVKQFVVGALSLICGVSVNKLVSSLDFFRLICWMHRHCSFFIPTLYVDIIVVCIVLRTRGIMLVTLFLAHIA